MRGRRGTPNHDRKSAPAPKVEQLFCKLGKRSRPSQKPSVYAGLPPSHVTETVHVCPFWGAERAHLRTQLSRGSPPPISRTTPIWLTSQQTVPNLASQPHWPPIPGPGICLETSNLPTEMEDLVAPDPPTLSREELYDLVWSEPMRTLAPRFGMSDVGLAKVCRRHSIPRPGVGYWAKRRHGKRVKKTPLPKLQGTKPGGGFIGLRPTHPEGSQKDPDGPLERQRRFESEHPIKVPTEFQEYTREVKRTRAVFRRTKRNERGLKTPKETGCLNLEVSKDQGDRAFLILEALVRAFRERGFPLSVRTEDEPRVSVEVLGEKVHFCLLERTFQEEPAPRRHRRSNYWLTGGSLEWKPPPPPRYQQTGELTLEILDHFQGGRKSWNDGKKQRLEGCLNSFILGLAGAALRIRAEREEREAREREWEERRRVEEEQPRRKEEEDRRRTILEAAMKCWREAEEVREFAMRIKETQASGQKEGGILPGLVELLPWMIEYADRVDPLTSVDPGAPLHRKPK